MDAVETEQLKGKNWLATMMLAWAFGIYGAHRFYTGKQGSAWAMAILSFLGCGLIITLPWMAVDLIMIALGNWRHEDGSELYERIPWLGYTLLVFVILVAVLFATFFVMLCYTKRVADPQNPYNVIFMFIAGYMFCFIFVYLILVIIALAIDPNSETGKIITLP